MTYALGVTKIVNMALTSIGKEMIENIDQKNDSAMLMKMYYPIVLKRVLSEYDWNFARRTVDLSQVTPPDEYKNYKYSFVLPEGYVAARRVRPEQYYEIYDNDTLRLNHVVTKTVDVLDEGDYTVIRQDTVEYVELTFTWEQPDPMKYNPGFSQYLAYSLAHETAFMLTGDTGLTQMALSLANSYQVAAQVEDATIARARFEPKEKPPWYLKKRGYLRKLYRDGGPYATEDFYK